MLLLKIKLTHKSESKLHNYDKILRCTNIKLLSMIYVTMYSCMMKKIRMPIHK